MSTLKVDAIRHNSATSDAITTHSDGTASAKIIDVGGAQLSNRNVIINGDAKIAQRATAQGSITSGGYYAVDRWYVTMDTAGTWTMYQDSDVPSGYGFSKSVSLDVNTANTSLSAGSRAMLSYRLEGQDVQRFCKGTANAKKYAVSFWVKCGKTGTYVLELFDHDNSRHICKTYTISSANTWEQKKLIFDNETSNPFGNDNGKSFELQFYLAAGSNFTSGTLATSWVSNVSAQRAGGITSFFDSTDRTFFLTGLQLEVGSQATPFEHRSIGDELLLCQRYFQIFKAPNGEFTRFGLAASLASNSVRIPIPHITEMRSKASFSYVGGNNDYQMPGSSNGFNISQVIYESNTSSTRSTCLQNGYVSVTTYNCYQFSANGQSNNAALLFDAEL